MRTADMHCDTIARLYKNQEEHTLLSNSFHVDLDKLKKGGYLLQNFAVFLDKEAVKSPYQEAMDMIGFYEGELASNEDAILPAYSYEDILRNDKKGKISAILTLEEGAVLEGRLENLHAFYERGVRMMAVSWNYPNEIGFPNLVFDGQGMPLFEKRQEKGLTDFGIETVREMERLGMVVDVSHLSDGGFWDVYRYTKAPFAASHSNAASVCNVSRNLTDEMLRALGERGGVAGLNFCAGFLSEKNVYDENGKLLTQSDACACVSTLSDMARHVRHMADVGGIEAVGLGSDFDGIGNQVEFADASGMERLSDMLYKTGFSWDEIDRIFYKNVLRLYRDVLRD